jgi:hypothetical protein
VETPRRRALLLGILALVIALHATIGWLFFATTRQLSILRDVSQTLQIVFIKPPVAQRKSGASEPLQTHRSGAAHAATDMRSLAAPSPPPAAPDDHVTRARIDWADELSRAAAGAVPAAPIQTPKDFGFPHAPTPQPPTTEHFGWDHTHTHRVESIAGGGLLINLNDNCVLVLNPLPFASCAPGKRKANGDLFKHMHDPSAANDDGDSP